MSVVNVVNDCAYVMQETLPHLNADFTVNFIRRTRGLWSKTVGVASKILRAPAGLFHVNYALQDAFLVDRLRRLDVLHCHGSDVRWVVNSRKWGWLVRRNLQHAKTVLFSTPDLYDNLKGLVENPVYMPLPVATDSFKPSNGAVCSGAVYFEKWYEPLPKSITALCNRHHIHLTKIPLGTRIPHEDMPRFLGQFSIYVDRFRIPSYSKTCLEAMSCGLVTVPQRDESLEETFTRISDGNYCHEKGLENRQYVLKNHDARLVAEKLKNVWNEGMRND